MKFWDKELKKKLFFNKQTNKKKIITLIWLQVII